ncbi:MAG: hypothetical protein NkDv07_0055 [Candidatus Improbicoccus devescovinae]|nr:MAG: hypothetical protein NkDv07_0055 [Candidatus Improbicoccus devescovinae]
MKILFIILCIFFIIFGLVDFIRFITLKLFYVKNKQKFEKIDIINVETANEAEFLLQNAATKIAWQDVPSDTKFVLLYSANDSETKKIINIATGNYGFIDLIRKD